MKKNVGIFGVVLLSSLFAFGSSSADEPSMVERSSVRYSAPIGGVDGQRLLISVAALGQFQCLPTCDLADTKFQVFRADATDLAPVAESPWTAIDAGRSFVFEYDFGDPDDALLRDEVIVRLEIVRRHQNPSRPNLELVASVQVVDLATNKNQLWGDWFIN